MYGMTEASSWTDYEENISVIKKYIHKKYFYKLKKYKVILENDIEKRKRMFKKN